MQPERDPQRPFFGKLLLWGSLAAAGLWLLDAAVDSHLVSGARFLRTTFEPTPPELWVRVLMGVLAFLAIGLLQRAGRAEKRLRLFAQVVDDAPDGVQIVDLAGHVTYSNKSVQRIYGFSPEELRGRHVGEMNVDRELASTTILPALQRDGRWAGELDVRHKAGHVFPIALSTSIVPDDRGRPQALVGLIQDITERRRAVEELKEHGRLAALTAEVALALGHTEPLAALLQHCAEAVVRHLDAAFARIWTVDATGQALRLQASAGLYTRLDGARSVVPIASESKIGVIAQTREPTLTNSVVGDPLIVDQDWAAREGIVSFAGYPLVVEDRLMGVIAMFGRRPLTEAAMQAMESVASTVALGIVRNDAESALRDNEERFRRIFEEGPLGMALLGPDQRIVRVNEALCEMLGRKAAELLGRAPAELAHPDSGSAAPEALRKLLDGTIPRFALEERWLGEGGATVWLRASASALRDAAGRPRLGLVMVEDVTEQKLFESQLRAAKERAEAAERTKSEFLHIASHELRTPLNALALNVETVRHRLARGRPVDAELVDRLMHQVRRLSYMVGNLLDSSRLERGDLVIRKVPLDFSALVASTVQDFRGLAPDRQVSLLLPGPTVTVEGDPTRIEQVVANLLDNALKYSPPGSSVEVQLAVAPRAATLTVTDHGIGIPLEQQDKLFTRFYRVTSDATRYQPGLGLGLYICNVIIESHGGTIRIDSEVGRGTTFVVTLPLPSEAGAPLAPK